MTRVLLTGGSGFIAAHVLDTLLQRGHSVVTTVRSQEKADKIKEAHPAATKSQLDFAIVKDIAQRDAFTEAVKSTPPFEAVIHTASPFHFNADDIQKDLLDPAVNGTLGLLEQIKKSAPTVKRVVITSSFAAILNPHKPVWPDHTYSEEDWNPLTHEEALQSQSNGYRASKTFAEKAAWDFVQTQKPNFDVATMNPPLVLGPIVHYLNSLSALNTSNQTVRNILLGQWKDLEELPAGGVPVQVDVRDLAEAHVQAMEKPDAANKRFFVVQGYFSNKEMLEIIRKNFVKYGDRLPSPTTPGGTLEKPYHIDNSRVKDVLGVKFRPFEETIVDLVKSLDAAGA